MKSSLVLRFVCLALATVTLLTAGCQEKIARCVVSGAVTSDGQPVPKGTIQFIPENPDPKLQVAGATADVIDGTYAISPANGLVAGKYKVCVISLVHRNKKTGDFVDPDDIKDGLVDPSAVEDVDLVPPGYGIADSEQYLEVGSEKKMTFDLDMKH